MNGGISVDLYVGTRLQKEREAKQLSPDHMASLIGTDVATYYEMEAGETRIGAGNLYTLAQELGIQITAFFTDLHEAVQTEDVSLKMLSRDEKKYLELFRSLDNEARKSLMDQMDSKKGPKH